MRVEAVGLLLHDAGDPAGAEAVFRRCLESYERRECADVWAVAETRGRLGACLTELGRFDEAADLLEASHQKLNETFGDAHPRTTRAADRLVTLYEAWGKPAEADRLRTPEPTLPSDPAGRAGG